MAKRAHATTRQEAPAPPEPRDRRARRRTPLRWAVPLCVVLVSALAYENATPNAAVHDDKFFVPNVFHLDAASVVRFFREDPWGAAGSPAARYRPLLLVSFAIDGAVFGTDLRGFHATNVLIHVGTTLLLYCVLAGLLRRSGREPFLAAGVAAAVFGVHPIHTEVVDSIFNRSEMFVALGILAAFAALLRWEGRRPLLAWTAVGGAYLAALLFRENSAVLPVLAVGFVWLLHPDEAWRPRLRRVLPAASLAVPLAIYLVLRGVALAHVVAPTAPPLSENVVGEGSVGERVALFVTTMHEYLRMMVWPHPLRASYENFAPRHVALAALGQALVFAAALWSWRRFPWLAFGLAFFYVALLPSTRLLTAASHASGLLAQPASGLILVAERTTYMPSVGLAFPLAFALVALGRRRRTAALAGAAVVVLGLAGVTLARNRDWHSDPALWEAEVRADPTNGDALRLLTGAYVDRGRDQETSRVCDRELANHPRVAQLANNCAIAYDRVGRPLDAEATYRHAIDLGLASVGHANLSRLLERLGRITEAEQEAARAVETEDEPGRRHFRRGLWLLKFHPDRLEEAQSEFEAATAILPDWGQPKSALAQVKTLRAHHGS